MTISFYIPYEIQPKQADRSAYWGGHIHHYQPKKVKSNADTLRLYARKYRPKVPLEGPLVMRLVFLWSWPKKIGKKKRELGRIPRETKPDFDNCCKQICDVLQHAGFYKNDAQLVDVRVRKFWSDQCGVRVRLFKADLKEQAGW